MAWNYSVLIHGYTSAGVFYDVTIEESAPDVANNTTTLTITHKIRIMSEWGGNYEIPYNTPIYVTIDGTKYTYTPSMPTVYAGQTKTITTTTHVITHSSNGSKTAVVNCRWNTSDRSYQGETGNKSLTLTTIPRASSMTAPNGTMGSSVTFTITRADSSFQHEITYSFAGHSGTAVSKTASLQPTFTPALSTFGPWLPNATSGEIQYTLDTYSGNTKIGSATYKATLSVPSSATIKMASTNPLVITTLNGFNNQMLAGKSQARLTATADTSSCYGATIKNYAFSIKNSSSTTIFSGNNPSTSTTAYADSSTMSSSGTFTAYVTISDSRGRTASTSKTFSVTAYSIPVINTVTIFRSDSGGTASDSGTYASIKANATYASGVSGNSLTMTVATKKNTDSSYGTAQSLTNGTAKVISGFDADSIYNILIVASDTVGGRVEYTGTLSNVDVGIAWDAVKDNMGLLVYPPAGAGSDEVYMPNAYALGPDGATFSKVLTSNTDQQVVSTYAGASGAFLVTHGEANKDSCFRATRSDTGVSLEVGVGSGGVNHGVYSSKLGKWLVYADNSNVYCNGTATNVTGTVAIANGGTGATTVAGAMLNLGAVYRNANSYSVYKSEKQSTFINMDAAETVDGVTFPRYAKGALATNSSNDATAYVIDTEGTLYTAFRNNGNWTRARKYGTTPLYSGTLASGSVTLTNATRCSLLVVVGICNTTSLRTSTVIPTYMIPTSDTGFQINDESGYVTFNVKASGANIVLTIRSKSSSATGITNIYGIN